MLIVAQQYFLPKGTSLHTKRLTCRWGLSSTDCWPAPREGLVFTPSVLLTRLLSLSVAGSSLIIILLAADLLSGRFDYRNQMARVLPRHGLEPRKGQPKCYACHKEFGFMRTQFTCKRCYRSVCEACSPDQQPTYSATGEKTVRRVCLGCSKELKLSRSMIDSSKVECCTDSEMAVEWLLKVNKRGLTFIDIKEIYIKELTSQTPSPEALRYRKLRPKVLGQLLEGLNYSLRNFLLMTSPAFDLEETERALSNCLIALLNRVKTLKFSPYLAFFGLFFLLFCSETTAFFIMAHLVEQYRLTEFEALSERILEFLLVVDRSLPRDLGAKYGKTVQVIVKVLTANVVKLEVTLFAVQQIIESDSPKELLLVLASVAYEVLKSMSTKESEKLSEAIYSTTLTKVKSTLKEFRPKESLLRPLEQQPKQNREDEEAVLSRHSSEAGSPPAHRLSIEEMCPEKEEEEESPPSGPSQALEVLRLQKYIQRMREEHTKEARKLREKISSLQKYSLTMKSEFEGQVQALNEEVTKLKRANLTLQRKRDELVIHKSSKMKEPVNESVGDFLQLISVLNKENREYLSQTEAMRERVKLLEQQREEQTRLQQAERKQSKRAILELRARTEELEFELQELRSRTAPKPPAQECQSSSSEEQQPQEQSRQTDCL